ncbi:hypothetical protein RB2654_14020 [Rhodobacterales bacterium HTCC2654]|uniref:Uncharacterized protein n=1 Tax=Maritimibacter alkaliphilus HTCC2654 TaxID=314271 RepID=A3VGK3_9RHOB|nr:hypothetical protein RB2654_14020 [Rhodobacterales bacterium HTCC2654] [Maritimibacter alkaliphilus HTCC2654]
MIADDLARRSRKTARLFRLNDASPTAVTSSTR